VRHLRNAQGLTLEEVAERGELYWTQVQRIELGKINPTLDTLERLAKGLGVPIGTLFSVPTPRFESNGHDLLSILQGRSEAEVHLITETIKCMLKNLPGQTAHE
jgi:transcriptional regulator with XRE-family HTH domain